jgi:tetratricopeptide (TPR) repeat protein
MSELNLADLPEVVPLKRVTPVWRVLTILAGIVIVVCIVGFVFLGIYILTLHAQLTVANLNAGFAPSPTYPPSTFNNATKDDDDDPPPAPVDNGNLPYPTHDDLRQLSLRPDFQRQAAPADPKKSARERFLRKGREVWKCPQQYYVNQVAVAPDGQHVAFFQGTNLVAGAFNNLRVIDNPDQVNKPGVVRPAWQRGAVQQPARQQPEDRLAGVPIWSTDSRFIYFASIAGRVQRYDLINDRSETMAVRGEWPAVIPTEPQSLLLVRSRPSPKVDVPGAPAVADRSELVKVDLQANQAQIVVPAGNYVYSHPAVSPNGAWLAVWRHDHRQTAIPRKFQVVLIDLRNPGENQVETLGIPADINPGPLCWSLAGSALVYERGQEAPLPPDCFGEDAPRFVYRATSLFEWHLNSKEETRLSRGTGFSSPSVSGTGELFYLTMKWDKIRNLMRLRSMTLEAAREFAAAEPVLPLRTAAAWTTLVERVCKAAKLPEDAAQVRHTPQLMGALATLFTEVYKAQFEEEAPSSPEGFDRQLREINSLKIPSETRQRLLLLLAAVRGEFLRAKHGAVWQLAEAAPQRRKAEEPPAESPFAFVVNIFERQHLPVDDDDDDDGRHEAAASLEWLLYQAEGRPLVLTNDPGAAQAAVAKLVDPDLARGRELFEKDQSPEAERVLEAMLKREKHKANFHLALWVGKLLYEYKRFQAVERLTSRICDQEPYDARKFNLQGLAKLDREPDQAIKAFKKAIRCDLHYGPAYLNLAQAYRQSNDTQSAIACLRRYLELSPYGPFTADASQRLAVLEKE